MRLTIKLGGSILEDESVRGGILRQVARLHGAHEVLLVHGGGKRLNRRLGQLGIESRFEQGLRVTDEATLQVAIMVLAGEVNKTLVLELGRRGVSPIGVCGADGLCVRCVPLAETPGAPTGLGYVGRPTDVSGEFFQMLFHGGFVPVVASIAVGRDGLPYNVNADQMASACAAGTGSRMLVYLTDVAGVRGADGHVIPRLRRPEVMELRAKGVISGGMLPKTDACLEALAGGVDSVCILPGAMPDILQQAIDGNLTEGTSIHET